MEYRTLGRSGASVSTLCLGTMTFGDESSEEVAHAQLDAFVEAGGAPGKYERRTISIVQETDDHAIVSDGLRAGEKAVSVGALLLAQMYDDALTTETGSIPSRGANAE